MRLVVHTKYGVFYGTEHDYDEAIYRELDNLLKEIKSTSYFSFETDGGEIYFPKGMIDDSLFIVEK